MTVADLDAEDLAAHAQEHLDDIRHALVGLTEIADHLTDRDYLAAVLYELHSLVVGWPTKGHPAKARETVDKYKDRLLNEAGEKAFDVPAIGRFECKTTTPRNKWQWDDLVSAVVKAGQRERRIIDPEAGEVESEGHAVARALRECVSFSQGKVTGLRQRGLDPDEFSEAGTKTYDVVLPPPPAKPMPRDDESEAAA